MRKLTVEEIDTRIAWFRQTNNADMVEFLLEHDGKRHIVSIRSV